jgi:hypothetical protein
MNKAGNINYVLKRQVVKLLSGIWIATLSLCFDSFGQTIPLHVGTSHPIRDEFGAPLQGYVGAASCDRVEILMAPDGVAHAPLLDGSPTQGNVVWEGGVTFMGSQVAPLPTNSGLFAASLAKPRPATGVRLFVRVFNAPTREAASFYGDSAVFTVSENPSQTYDVNIGTLQPLDPNDNDGDGLNNSMEKSLGSNPENVDTDGDGRSDYEEYVAESPLTDSSYLIADFHMDGNGHPVVAWEASPDNSYRIEYTTDLDGGSSTFEELSGAVTAGDLTAETIVTNELPDACGFFRVRRIEP